MGSFTAGEVILVPFPFSDLSNAKLRPALVLADAGRGDWILCQITSNPYSDPLAVQIQPSDFQAGSLPVTSYARPGKIFTASQSLFISQAGKLTPTTLDSIIEAIVQLLKPS